MLSRYDSAWLAAHKIYIDYFLRDIINPSRSDPYFPVTRHRDWFAGHSWGKATLFICLLSNGVQCSIASGVANGAGSRDEESSGEGINGYYGAMLWAQVTGNTDIYNYARMLHATEQHGAQVYWHLYPAQSATARDQPYPEQAVRNLITMGNVEDWQAGAWL